MVELKSERVNIILNVGFAPPIFEWGGIPARFFDMVYSALTPAFTVDLNDFQVPHLNALGDVITKYKIFGGTSTISLSAEKLSAEFPMVLLPDDDQLIEQILFAIGQGFTKKFPECNLTRVQASWHAHTSVVSGGSASEYLAQFEIPAVNLHFCTSGASYIPGAFFMAMGKDATWQARCSVEQSLYMGDALFLSYDVTLNEVDPSETLDMQFKRTKTVMEECASALNLSFQ